MPAIPKPVSRPQGSKPVRLASIKNPQPHPPPEVEAEEQPPPKKQKVDRVLTCTDRTCDSEGVVESEGNILCATCGTVLQDANIVSDQTFIETAGGESMRAGVNVAAGATRAKNYDPVASRVTGGMDSRELSEAKGKQAIRTVASYPLNIQQPEQDYALQVYKLARGNNFIQGRVTNHVAAVCLYIACRRKRANKDRGPNQWMLIDFADKCDIKVNVFKLGTVFKDLMDTLALSASFFQENLVPVSIESLIERFAKQMNFGSMAGRIAQEAIRIVQRMKRDWIGEGRRPAGICGAALILAARMNNFRRVVREVVYTVKVAEVTVSKRLEEFKDTESGTFTVDQFRNADLEGGQLHDADPPAFKNKDKVKKKRGKSRKSRTAPNDGPDNISERAESVSSTSSTASNNANEQLQTPADTQAERDRQSMPPPPLPIDPALRPQAASQGSNPLPTKRGRGRPKRKQKPVQPPSDQDLQTEAEIEATINEVLEDRANEDNARLVHENPDARIKYDRRQLATPESSQQSASRSDTVRSVSNTEQSPAPTISSQADHREAESSTTDIQDLSESRQDTHRSPSPVLDERSFITSTSTSQDLLDRIRSTENISDEEFGSDPELRDCLLTDAERNIKERIWTHENSQYLRKQQSKLLKQQLAEANGTARVVVKRKRRSIRMGDVERRDGLDLPTDAGDAVGRMMQTKAYSRKINYGNIKEAFRSERGETPREGSVAASDDDASAGT
ncbi:MAG: hypothetical protein Q9174_002098, partial [Haloplaca sp. 1 TL-2023]